MCLEPAPPHLLVLPATSSHGHGSLASPDSNAHKPGAEAGLSPLPSPAEQGCRKAHGSPEGSATGGFPTPGGFPTKGRCFGASISCLVVPPKRSGSFTAASPKTTSPPLPTRGTNHHGAALLAKATKLSTSLASPPCSARRTLQEVAGGSEKGGTSPIPAGRAGRWRHATLPAARRLSPHARHTEEPSASKLPGLSPRKQEALNISYFGLAHPNLMCGALLLVGCGPQELSHPFVIPAHLLEVLHWGFEARRPRFLVLPRLQDSEHKFLPRTHIAADQQK